MTLGITLSFTHTHTHTHTPPHNLNPSLPPPKRIPLYPFFKFALFVWMFSPSTQGGHFVYANILCPFFKSHTLVYPGRKREGDGGGRGHAGT